MPCSRPETPRSGVTVGVTVGARAKCCAVRGGVQHKTRWGCSSTTFHFPLFLFGFFVLNRPTRAAPAERERTGATPPFSPLARLGVGGGVAPGATPGATPSPLAKRGRSRPKSSFQEGSNARPRARADAPTSGAMTRRVIGFLLTVGETCWWHWPDVSHVDDPVAVLVHRHTPNLYRAIVACCCVAPAAGVSITGQVVIAAFCVWFARSGGGLPLPAPTAFASR